MTNWEVFKPFEAASAGRANAVAKFLRALAAHPAAAGPALLGRRHQAGAFTRFLAPNESTDAAHESPPARTRRNYIPTSPGHLSTRVASTGGAGPVATQPNVDNPR